MSLDAHVHLQVGPLHLDAALEVASGETVAILGPNGAGKTTLVRALAGLVTIDRGHIRLDGRELDGGRRGAWVPPEERPTATVFQDHRLFPHLSALDNVAFGLRARGISRSKARSTAADWLSSMDLEDQIHLRPTRLSGGQSQRVALARALALEPRLLLLDEPLASLDVSTRASTRRDLGRLFRSQDSARVLVTHDLTDALTLADRLVVLEEGRVVQEGTPEGLMAAPGSPFVADLVLDKRLDRPPIAPEVSVDPR